MPNQIKIRPLKDKLRQFFSPVVYECSVFRNNGKPIGGFADENEIADAFSPTHTYVVGEPCIYENVVRICTTPHNGNWDASHFRSTSVMRYAQELSQSLAEYQKKVWNLITTLSGTTGGSYPRTGDYTEMLVTITTTTNKINSVTLPFTDNFSGRISVTIDNGVYEIYFNGSGACQGSNANATYRIYYR